MQIDGDQQESATAWSGGPRADASRGRHVAGLGVTLEELPRLGLARQEDPSEQPGQDAHRCPGHERTVEVDALRASFLRAVAHDLRGSLSIISGMGATLAERHSELPPDVRIELAESIARQGRRLLSTLEDLLGLDRLALDRTAVTRRCTDVDELVEDVVAALVQDEHVQVRLRLEAVTAWVDAGLLERVVENLVRNAIEHQVGDDPVDVHLRRVAHPDGDRFEIRVLDRGPGVPPAEREQIFLPYFQGDRRGVGLSIARAFARMHHGEVTVEDRPDGGSVFVASMPVHHVA